MKFKRLMILFAIVSLFIGCASTPIEQTVDPYKNLTMESVKEQCKPAGFWNVGVMGNPAIIIIYDSCNGIDNLLVVAAPDIKNNEKLTKAVMDIVYMSYLEYRNDMNKAQEWTAKLIKKEFQVHHVDKEVKFKSYVTFYILQGAVKEKKE